MQAQAQCTLCRLALPGCLAATVHVSFATSAWPTELALPYQQ